MAVAGPGKAWSARDQGAYLFELVGRKPFFLQVPVALMDGIIAFLDFLVRFFPAMEVRPSCCTGQGRAHRAKKMLAIPPPWALQRISPRKATITSICAQEPAGSWAHWVLISSERT